MLIVINSIGKTTEKFVFYFTGLSFSRVGRALFNHYAVESRLSLIVRVNVVLTRTVAVDSVVTDVSTTCAVVIFKKSLFTWTIKLNLLLK